MQRRVLVFTRYPEPSKTKTRLIPTLGAQGAADLQREMTRHTLRVVQTVAAKLSASFEVCFEGGNADKMAACFGDEIQYNLQCQGDLGERMHRAFRQAASEGMRQMVLIGTDCPDITPELLAEAFDRLAGNDLVLGPARDGGYYLIGLRNPTPSLFDTIAWGSDRVLRETLRRADRLALGVSLLETLSDVDRPEDLPAWHRVKRRSGHVGSRHGDARISVIIPTLDEADYLPGTLDALRHAQPLETIVVDGGSHDATPRIAEQAGCRLLHASPGRALQMNTGAQAADGSVLLFLHADTRPPRDFSLTVAETLGRPEVAAGAFRLRIDAPGWSYRIVERAVDFRARRLQMPYGDQGLFLGKETFDELGGYPILPIMEDFEFVRRVRRRGRIAIAQSTASTSARRWQRLGPWRTTWLNQKVILGYHLGIPPERLATWYHGSGNK